MDLPRKTPDSSEKTIQFPESLTVVDPISGDARRATVADGDAGEAVPKNIAETHGSFRAVDERDSVLLPLPDCTLLQQRGALWVGNNDLRE